ncbi:hypothetical protein M2263_000528 [Providencia alcalifaciens]|nr:hypothetical protein [Providencia alcalifaciens]
MGAGNKSDRVAELGTFTAAVIGQRLYAMMMRCNDLPIAVHFAAGVIA